MGKILDDMTRLREDMDRGHDARRAAGRARADEMAELANGVADMIGGFASERAAQFSKDQAVRGAFIGNIVQDVQDLTQELGTMMERVHDDRMETARADAATRRQAVEDRVEDIRARMGDFREQMAAFRDEFAAASEQDARVRLGFVADKAREVADMLGDFRRTHAEETAADAEARQEFIADIGSRVRTLQDDVSADLAGIRALFDGGISVGSKPVAKPERSPARPKAQAQAGKPTPGQQPAPAAKPAETGAMGSSDSAMAQGDAAMATAADPGNGKRSSKKEGAKSDA